MTATIKGTRGKELSGVGNKGSYLLPGQKPKLRRFVQLIKNPDGEAVEIKQVPSSEYLATGEELDKGLIRKEKHSIARKETRAAHRDGLFNEIQTMKIRIPTLSREELLDAAIVSYNRDHQRVCGCGMTNVASINSTEAFLQRIQVNYLRHRCVDYDRTLSRIADYPGAHRARTLLRKRIHAKISALYPHLELECRRQDGLSKKQLARISEQIETCRQIS